MSKQTFNFFLHNNFSSYEMREFMEASGIVLSEEAWENVGDPFYEVGLHCEVNENGKVTILEVF